MFRTQGNWVQKLMDGNWVNYKNEISPARAKETAQALELTAQRIDEQTKPLSERKVYDGTKLISVSIGYRTMVLCGWVHKAPVFSQNPLLENEFTTAFNAAEKSGRADAPFKRITISCDCADTLAAFLEWRAQTALPAHAYEASTARRDAQNILSTIKQEQAKGDA